MEKEAIAVKLIWDFKGPDAEQTAKHHALHLMEYAKKHLDETNRCGAEKEAEQHYIAYMHCSPLQAKAMRDVLKPARANWLE